MTKGLDQNRNVRINALTAALWDVYTDNDPEQGIKSNRVWDLLAKFDAEVRIEAVTLPNHKGTRLFGAAYSCSCGWTSAVFFGKGARDSAAHDFHSHKVNCLKAA